MAVNTAKENDSLLEPHGSFLLFSEPIRPDVIPIGNLSVSPRGLAENMDVQKRFRRMSRLAMRSAPMQPSEALSLAV